MNIMVAHNYLAPSIVGSRSLGFDDALLCRTFQRFRKLVLGRGWPAGFCRKTYIGVSMSSSSSFFFLTTKHGKRSEDGERR